MTLITEYHAGHTRRCDARCHDARCHDGKHAKCKCICGGANHGKGLRQAMENTQAMAEELMKRDGIKIADIQRSLTDQLGAVAAGLPPRRP